MRHESSKSMPSQRRRANAESMPTPTPTPRQWRIGLSYKSWQVVLRKRLHREKFQHRGAVSRGETSASGRKALGLVGSRPSMRVDNSGRVWDADGNTSHERRDRASMCDRLSGMHVRAREGKRGHRVIIVVVELVAQVNDQRGCVHGCKGEELMWISMVDWCM